MSVLLLRLTGPMQSWGIQSRFTVRDTGLEPSKSGVIGLLCAALGRPRHESVADLAALHMGVRVDREGRMACDYHTARDVLRADTKSGRQETVVSYRYYLADADFLVALDGNHDLLGTLHAAVEAPKWPLYLGRKSFPLASRSLFQTAYYPMQHCALRSRNTRGHLPSMLAANDRKNYALFSIPTPAAANHALMYRFHLPSAFSLFGTSLPSIFQLMPC
jgi:CRISPR-associated protein Cas5/CasD subtype I-E